MKAASVLFALTVVMVAARGMAAINFATEESTRQEDGFTVHETFFTLDASHRVFIQAPMGWDMKSSQERLSFFRRGPGNASCVIEQSGIDPSSTAFDPAGLQVYRRSAMSLVPSGSLNVAILQENPDSLHLFGWKTYEFVTGFDFFAALSGKPCSSQISIQRSSFGWSRQGQRTSLMSYGGMPSV